MQEMVKSSQAVEKMLAAYSKCTIKFNSSCHKVIGKLNFAVYLRMLMNWSS